LAAAFRSAASRCLTDACAIPARQTHEARASPSTAEWWVASAAACCRAAASLASIAASARAVVRRIVSRVRNGPLPVGSSVGRSDAGMTVVTSSLNVAGVSASAAVRPK